MTPEQAMDYIGKWIDERLSQAPLMQRTAEAESIGRRFAIVREALKPEPKPDAVPTKKRARKKSATA